MEHSWRDPHMIRTTRSLAQALFATLGVFVAFLVLFHIASALYASFLSASELRELHAGIDRELNILKAEGDALVHNQALVGYLMAGDTDALLSLLQQEARAHSIGTIGVANSEGVIVSRTRKFGVQGDNVFLTFPEGRVVAKGESVQSIGQAVINPNLLRMTAGTPIMYQGRMIGGLFASNLMDDAYALRFKNTYLSSGTQVVFYNKQFGIYGDSFTDPSTRKLLDSYFSSGSDWIADGTSDKTISFDDGRSYLVENVVFPGLEQSTGGALLFIPRRDISDVANVATALLTLCVFLFLALKSHAHTRGEERGWRYYCILITACVPVFVLAFIALHAQNIGQLRLERIPYTLYNSTLRLQPESGIYDAGFQQRFTVVVDTGDEPINAVQIGLLFDPRAIEVKEIDTATSTCTYVVEKKIDQVLGRADLSCVILDAKGQRGSFPIADVVILPQHTGTFTLSFDTDTTKVLASDGLGTDVLRASQAGSYRVDTFSPWVSGDGSATSTGRSFVVFSPTHPNQARWYNEKNARFVWQGKKGAVYRYAFDAIPDTTPSNKNTTDHTAVELPVPGDGIFYFHLQLATGGPIAHYRVQVDKISPSITSMHFSSENIVAGDVVRFSFDAEDAGSGVQRNYYVDLGNHLFLPVGAELFVPFQESGDQQVVLRVYDGAGNFSEKTTTVHVAPAVR